MNCAIAKLVTIGLLQLGANGEKASKEPRSVPDNDRSRPPVSVKIRDAAPTAFRDHRGPYWTVGPEFTRLQHYLDDNGLTAPMFARFLNRPGTVPANELSTEIGFFVPGSHKPDNSFKTAGLKPQMVAYTVLIDGIESKAKDLARIRSWIFENDYEQTGPIMEIYRSQGGGSHGERWETEVQIPVRKKRSHEVTTTRPIPPPPETNEQADLPGLESIPISETPINSVTKMAETQVPRILTSESVPTRSTNSSSAGPSESNAGRNNGAHAENFDPGHDAFVPGHASAIADAVMPENHGIDGFDPVWRGHACLRMMGVLQGIERSYSSEASWAAALRLALADRLESYVAGLPKNPKHQAVVTYGAVPPQVMAREKEITRMLDGLLIKIGTGAASAEQVKSELALVIDRLRAPEA